MNANKKWAHFKWSGYYPGFGVHYIIFFFNNHIKRIIIKTIAYFKSKSVISVCIDGTCCRWTDIRGESEQILENISLIKSIVFTMDWKWIHSWIVEYQPNPNPIRPNRHTNGEKRWHNSLFWAINCHRIDYSVGVLFSAWRGYTIGRGEGTAIERTVVQPLEHWDCTHHNNDHHYWEPN